LTLVPQCGQVKVSDRVRISTIPQFFLIVKAALNL